MTTIRASLVILGENFSPARFERLSPVKLTESHEPGAIAKNGRFRGKPVASGSAVIQVSNKPESWGRFDELAAVIGGCINELRDAGAESLTLSCSLFHDGDCNFGFSHDQLQRIATFKVDLQISCYERTDHSA